MRREPPTGSGCGAQRFPGDHPDVLRQHAESRGGAARRSWRPSGSTRQPGTCDPSAQSCTARGAWGTGARGPRHSRSWRRRSAPAGSARPGRGKGSRPAQPIPSHPPSAGGGLGTSLRRRQHRFRNQPTGSTPLAADRAGRSRSGKRRLSRSSAWAYTPGRQGGWRRLSRRPSSRTRGPALHERQSRHVRPARRSCLHVAYRLPRSQPSDTGGLSRRLAGHAGRGGSWPGERCQSQRSCRAG